MARRRLGISAKTIGFNVVLLVVTVVLQLMLTNRISRAIASAKEQGRRIDRLNELNVIANKLAETRYWLSDVALTWDMSSIDKAKSAQKVLNAGFKSLSGVDPAAVSTTEKKIEALFDTTINAVTFFATGDKDGGAKMIKNARVINEDIDRMIAGIVASGTTKSGTAQASVGPPAPGTVAEINDANPTDQIVDTISAIQSVAAVSASITAFGLLLFCFVSQRSVVTPIREALKHLLEISKANFSASRSLAESSENLLNTTQDQAAAIEESVAAMTELKSMVSRTAESAQGTRESSDRVAMKTQSGLEAMGRMVTHMDVMDGAVADVINSMNDMERKTNQQLGSVAGIVDDVAEKAAIINNIVLKTQLLSFNASIEAARAGQHGRGFAVVAQEVGALSRIIGKAAQGINELVLKSKVDIKSVIDDMQQQISHSKTSVQKSKAIAKEAVAATHSSNEIFEAIALEMRDVKSKVAFVTDATIEQSKGLDQISLSMSDLQRATDKNSAASDKNRHLSDKLKQESDRLQSLGVAMGVLVEGSVNLRGMGRQVVTFVTPKASSLMDDLMKNAAPGEATAHSSEQVFESPTSPVLSAVATEDSAVNETIGEDVVTSLIQKIKTRGVPQDVKSSSEVDEHEKRSA